MDRVLDEESPVISLESSYMTADGSSPSSPISLPQRGTIPAFIDAPPDSPDVWFDAIPIPLVPPTLALMSTTQRSCWGASAVLLWFLALTVSVAADKKLCHVCRILRKPKFFDDTFHLLALFAAFSVVYVGLVLLLVLRKFGGDGFRVTGRGKLFLQIAFGLLSCYVSTFFTDKLSIIVACFMCLWTIPMCNLLVVVDDFGVLEGALSILNYAVIGGFGHSIVGWLLVFVAVTFVMCVKYDVQRWHEGRGSLCGHTWKATLRFLPEMLPLLPGPGPVPIW